MSQRLVHTMRRLPVVFAAALIFVLIVVLLVLGVDALTEYVRS